MAHELHSMEFHTCPFPCRKCLWARGEPIIFQKSDKSENEKEGGKSGNLAEEPERAETNSPGWGVFCEPITSLRLALQDARMAGSLCPGALMPTEYE